MTEGRFRFGPRAKREMAALKLACDPENVLHLNHNVRP
jgi:hypothetical protein